MSSLVRRLVLSVFLLEALVFLMVAVSQFFSNSYTLVFAGGAYFIGGLFLVPLCILLVATNRKELTRWQWLLTASLTLIMVITAIPIALSGLVGAQFFGFSFELSSGAAIFILVSHALAVLLYNPKEDYEKSLFIHAAGVTSLFNTVALFWFDESVLLPAAVLLNIIYAFYCAVKIDETTTNSWLWAPLLLLIPLLLLVPLHPFVLILFAGIIVLLQSASFGNRKSFALYVLIFTLLSSAAITFVTPERSDVLNHHHVELKWVPRMLEHGVLREDDALKSFIGTGPGGALNLWLSERPDHVIAEYESRPDPQFVGSLASTHFLATGFVGLLLWVVLFCVLAWRVYFLSKTLYINKGSNVDTFELLAVLVLLCSIFMTVPSYTTLVGALLLLAAFGTRSDTEDNKPTLRWFTKLALFINVLPVTFVALLAAKHASSVLVSQHHFNEAIRYEELGDSQEALWSLLAATDAREHSVIYRSLAVYYQNQLREKLDTNADGREIEGDMGRVIKYGSAAVAKNPLHYENWLVLGNGYLIMSQVGVEDAASRARQSYKEAKGVARKEMDVIYMQAQQAAMMGDYESAYMSLDRLQTFDPDSDKFKRLQTFLDESSAKAGE